MELRRDVFQAIADPTRRDIIQMLCQRPLNLKSVASHFDLSRPAISKHVRILSECGVIVIKNKGRERYCYADLSKLKEVDKWVSYYRKFWNTKMDSLGEFLESEHLNEL